MDDDKTSSSSSFTDTERDFMRLALRLAETAHERWEVPVGCVFVDGETNEVISCGQNETNETRNGTRHAEFVALENALKKKKKKMDEEEEKTKVLFFPAKRLDVYVTCEPCVMCAAMLGQLPCERVKVTFGCANDKFGGGGTCLSVHEMEGMPSCLGSSSPSFSKAYECVGGLYRDEAVELFQRFYVRGNPKAPVPHREVKEYPQKS
jgi:tRNA-specific adenosine deaminase 2